MMSNLDDMHENGIHDYMKFIKVRKGRCSDHASKDIRTGYMTRDEGIAMVRKYDHVKPRRDLERWLGYVDMTEDEFDHIADTFRDPRVWWQQDGEWWKDTIWGGPEAFGEVKVEELKFESRINKDKTFRTKNMNKEKVFSENDIRPSDLVKKQKVFSVNDLARLLSRNGEFVDVACPACGAVVEKDAFVRNSLHYKCCPECDTLFISPRPTEEILKWFYKNSENYEFWEKHIFPASEEVRRRRSFVLELSKFLRFVRSLVSKRIH